MLIWDRFLSHNTLPHSTAANNLWKDRSLDLEILELKHFKQIILFINAPIVLEIKKLYSFVGRGHTSHDRQDPGERRRGQEETQCHLISAAIR